MSREHIRQAITDLARQRPKYLREAKQRAKRLAKEGKIECPVCNDGTLLDILHVFPPLKPNLDDPILDTDWHVRCLKCGHEDWFTIKFNQDDEQAKPLMAEFEKNKPKRKRKRT